MTFPTWSVGEVLTAADMNTVGAICSTSVTGFKNAIINGDFSVNQRSFISTTTGATYGFDRWRVLLSGGTVTYSTQAFTLGNQIAGQEPTNFARIVTSGQSAAGDLGILEQPIEGVRTFAGQTITISFWAKAASGTPKIAAEIIQNFGTGGSPSAVVNNYVGQVTLSTSWARYSLTFNVPSISGKTLGTANDQLNLYLWVSGGSTWNSRNGSLGIQNNTFDFWGVQVEAGSVMTFFERRPRQVELALCQRYYEKSYDMATALGTLTVTGAVSVIYSGVSGAATGFRFQVRKRATPQVRGYPIVSGTNNGVGYWTSSGDAINRAVTFGSIGESGVRFIQLTGSTTASWYEGHYEAEAEL